MTVQKKEIIFFCILYELLKSFKYKLVDYPYSGMWLQKTLPTFDEPFIICFDLKDHRLSNLLKFQYHRVGIFNSFAAYDTYLTE